MVDILNKLGIGNRKENEKENASVHKSTLEMYERTGKMNIPTIFDRYNAQQPQCTYGAQGICCQLCSHGPCRITNKATVGICGATADVIAARNFLRLTAGGSAAYTHHLEMIAKTLKATAQGKTTFKIQDPGKLKSVAGALGLDTNKSTEDLAIALADAVLSEVKKSADEPLLLVEKFAPKTRLEVWKKLGIMPGGTYAEVGDAMTKTLTSIDTDPVDLLLTTLKVGIATGYMGLVATITLQDILLGTPTPTTSSADLGIIDPKAVNIVAHGHVPLMATAVLRATQSSEMQKLAKEAGASDIKLLGSMCTGQELMQRSATSAKGFAGQTGNWINQEYLIATGAIDLVMMDLNCSTPGLKNMADHFHTRVISVDKLVRMAGVTDHLDFNPEKADEQAMQIVKMSIDAYKMRDKSKVHIPKYKSEVMAGFSVESCKAALGGTWNPLIDAIKAGSVKGIVAVVGCTTAKTKHDTVSVKLSRELIKRNILVINAGCVSSAIQIEGLMKPEAADQAGEGLKAVCRSLHIPPCLNYGSCVDIGRIGVAVTEIAAALGVDPSALPVAASAPEYLEQKAVADGAFAVAFGLLLHLAPVPPVTGAPLVAKVLTNDVESLTGGKVLVELDPVKAADAIEAHINTKRKALGLPV
ncbi:MAG: anaerobic carbon-monoxide dehydrogenase catalytic subunit [Candidatus Methanoperedens sp.]|nr:anaerobic carbon-monoxide dehydrogenase catalytic subunit [Candidatus Methanoperedens sp. BLZ2]KAB2946917.1 MAG: anaerobic carbon-monoxide dehydrogenase catalytic subunit [Candidatus Methanoperedens sp.]MBZ0176713.1 anaerobic carbon-monoxide dehydrogenase catalytic subunit [Candidatus Methanoperedens nitroreducens]MCX9080435.1 anaerobic carbon-monoxide dehydrogenase catalytic subunit [Candidatus Methanoperedens sp.]